MTRLRLSPSASVIPTGSGLVLRSDLSSIRLDGPDVAAAASEILPLLDGTRDLEAIVSALPRYSARSVDGLVQALLARGLVEAVADDAAPPAERPWAGQEAFLREWTGRQEEAMDRIRRGRVLLAGLEPWGVTAARDLAAAGLGRIALLDDRHRADAVCEAMARDQPWCRCTSGALYDDPGRDDGWDVVAVALPADELRVTKRLATFAQRANLLFVSAHLDGMEAVLGPVVLPGRTACWNCARLRQLAAGPGGEDERALQEALLRERPQRRERTLLAPMADVLGHLLALEILKLVSRYTESALVGRLMVQHLVTLDSAFHTVVRLPWCDVCGGADRGGGGDGGPALEPVDGPRGAGVSLDRLDDPERLRTALAGLVDGRAGIVRYLVVNEPSAGEPELPVAATAVLASQAGTADFGSGKGLTAVEAMLGAVGEALERYSAAICPPGRRRRASLDELAGGAFDPRWLGLYSPEQYASDGFPFAPFDPARPIDWTRGRWCDSDEPVWLPALPTYFDFPAPPEERFCQVTSNGLAAGSTLADAELRAVLEVVERDAFMMTWLRRLPARRIALDGLDAGSQEVVRQLGLCGCETRLYLLDAGIDIPAVACVGLGDGVRWPGATVSLAAHLSPGRAVRRAIVEQGHVGPYVRRLMLDGAHRVPDRAEAVRTLVDHALFYVPPERRPAIPFLADEAPPVALRDLPEPPEITMAECVRRLAAANVRAAVADVTSPDLAGGPFHVARALATHLQPIHFGHGLVQLGNPRLQPGGGAGLNPHPHPLA